MTIQAVDIASFLNAPLRGPDISVTTPKSLISVESGAFIFMTKAADKDIERVNNVKTVLCVTTEALACHLTCTVVAVENPRLAFAQTLSRFFVPENPAAVSAEAVIDPAAQISANVSIGPGSNIGPDVIIGADTTIGANVVIAGNVTIGNRCTIKSNSTIGEAGFGFVRKPDGTSVPFPHIGRVEIGDFVEVGANCTVVRAALDATVLEAHVKTDDHVHIAHNCHVGSGTFIAAGAVLSGSVQIGRNAWISPNATIIDYGKVGDDAFVGIGSVVTKPVAAKARVFGVPAKPIGSRRKRSSGS